MTDDLYDYAAERADALNASRDDADLWVRGMPRHWAGWDEEDALDDTDR